MFESRGLRVSVIYGGLSPEVRRNEARRFREGQSDIVCATDAIGLGLNLPLDRVIFYETDKFDGEIIRRLEPSELLQIGGRAGRGPDAKDGWRRSPRVTRDESRPRCASLKARRKPDQLPAAPTAMHVRAIADHLGLDRLGPILEFFRTRLTFPGGTFFPEVREAVFSQPRSWSTRMHRTCRWSSVTPSPARPSILRSTRFAVRFRNGWKRSPPAGR